MAIHQTSHPTTRTRITHRDIPQTSLTPNLATRTGPIEEVVATTTMVQIDECQGQAPPLLMHRKAVEVVAQPPHSFPICRGHQLLAQEAADLPQKRPAQTHRQHKHRPNLLPSMLTTIHSAHRKTYEWRMRGRKRARRCRHQRSRPLLLQHNPSLASVSLSKPRTRFQSLARPR